MTLQKTGKLISGDPLDSSEKAFASGPWVRNGQEISCANHVGRNHFRLLACVAAGISLLYLFAPFPFVNFPKNAVDIGGVGGYSKDVCPQTAPIAPDAKALDALEALFQTQGFKQKAYESLGGAVRIPTVIYDDLPPPGEDPHWEIFGDLHRYLEQQFPLVHATLRKTVVNKYALVYHWQGSNSSAKPILLAAHQDVVPVEPLTLDQWKQPPFSGLYDGEWIWGRGSCDDKPGLIGSLIAIEELLRTGFEPSRSVVLAYGIDEERGGVSGATAIRDYLVPTYGKDSFSILIDEGGGYTVKDDVIVSTPGVAEKGNLNARLEVSTPGGHSSVPPAHTGIGILAALIAQLEDHPHTSSLNRTGVYYQNLQCQAEHDTSIPAELKKLIEDSRSSDSALRALEDELKKTDKLFAALTGTTQAVDVIKGGVKANALPERADALVNHRIGIHSSVAELQERLTKLVVPIAERFGLSLEAFNETILRGVEGESNGHLRIFDAFGTALEPAPATPLGESGPFKFLSGTVRGVLGTSNRTGYDKTVFIAPGMPTGNTDTKHYWKLTKHIFRYGHSNSDDRFNGAHTVNEALRAEGFIEIIRFFTWVILNADKSPLLE